MFIKTVKFWGLLFSYKPVFDYETYYETYYGTPYETMYHMRCITCDVSHSMYHIRFLLLQ